MLTIFRLVFKGRRCALLAGKYGKPHGYAMILGLKLVEKKNLTNALIILFFIYLTVLSHKKRVIYS